MPTQSIVDAQNSPEFVNTDERSPSPKGKMIPSFSKALARSAIPMGVARTLVGAAVLLRPSLLATTLGVDSQTAQRTTWIARSFAGRDLAIGVGSVAGSRGCQAAGVASDASDFVAMLLAVRAKQLGPMFGGLTAAASGGAALVGLAALLVTRK
jgi:hypothetical protein